MDKKRLLLALIVIPAAITGFLASCDSTTSTEYEPVWDYYTTGSGLPSNMVYEVWPGPSETWFATNAGVAEIDGPDTTIYSVENSDLPSNDCMSIDNENLKYIWVGTKAGAVRIDGNGNITVFDTTNGLPHNTVRSVVWDGLHIWLGTDAGLARFDDPGFTVFTTTEGLPANTIFDIFAVDSEDIWIATNGGGAHYKEGTITVFNSTTISGFPSDDLFTVAAKENDIWFGSSDSGVFRYKDNELTVFTDTNSKLGSSMINDIDFSSYGKLYVATVGGVSRFNYEDNDFVTYTQSGNLPADAVLSVAPDYTPGTIYDYVYFCTIAGVARLGQP